ncbi:MAG TPA: protein kinase [Clostridiales bacterium]|nr:protein kinase [Clostridiales bacterium]
MDTFEKLSETYEIIEIIGSGGGGTVYKARHKRLDKEVVIKKIHTDIKDVVDCGAEANILKKLRHSYLPQVLDLLTINNNVYTVMDFIPGQSFQQLLDEKKRFPQKKVIKWATQLAEALVYLHKQNPPIIHSDIKPANIMLTPSDDICLIDFNISSIFTGKGARTIGFTDGYSPPEQYKIYYDSIQELSTTTNNLSSDDKTELLYQDETTELLINATQKNPTLYPNEDKRTELLFNPEEDIVTETELLYDDSISDKAYKQVATSAEGERMPSETILGYALVDEKSDIYSLGATLYHLITGVKPQKSTETVVSVANYGVKISDGLVHIITKAMHKNPGKRFPSASQLLKSLMNIGKLDRRYKRFMLLQEVAFIIMLLLFSGSVLLIHFGGLKMSQEKQELYQEYISQLDYERQLGNYDEMESIYTNAVSLYPDKIEAYYQRALSLYERQDYYSAIEYIEETIIPDYDLEQSQKMEDVYFILANCYFELEKYEDAIIYFRSAIALNKSNSQYYRDFAISLARIGNIPKASEALEEAIKLGIADDSVYLINGEIDLSNNDYISSEDNLKKCIEVAGDPYIKMRAYIKCEELYNAIILTEKDDNLVSETLLKKIALLKEAKSALPLDLTLVIYERLIQAYIDGGTYFNDNDYYRLAIEESNNMILNWENYNTYNNMIILYHKIGEIDNAFKTADLMIQKYGEDYNIYKRLSFLELDVQSLKANESRDYSIFLDYYNKANDLYKRNLKNNKNDMEMIHLDEAVDVLEEGGWFD